MTFLRKILPGVLGITIIAFLTFGCGTSNIIIDSLADDRRIKPAANPYYERDKKFILFYDGTKVYGKNVSHTSGLLGGTTKMDGKRYKTRNIRAIVDGAYRHSIGNNYAGCIIWGKISVYELFTSHYGTYYTPNNAGGNSKNTYSSEATKYYLQVGENGELIKWTKLNQLRAYIKDCPKAIAMLDNMSKKVVKQAFDDSHLVKIIRLYNNNCQ